MESYFNSMLLEKFSNTINKNKSPWFFAKEVFDFLEYSEDERKKLLENFTTKKLTIENEKKEIFIKKICLYKLILTSPSKNVEVEKLKDFIINILMPVYSTNSSIMNKLDLINRDVMKNSTYLTNISNTLEEMKTNLWD